MTERNKQSTGLYIHIPFCRSRCSYCGFVSCVNIERANDYVNALTSEISQRVKGNIDSIYVGGGTPSVLPAGLLGKIFSAVRKKADISKDCEITCEANPDSCTSEFLSEATDCGVNRISLGVQSLNDDILRAIGRRHTARVACDAVRLVLKHGINNVSCDMILGLPEQTENDVVDTVNAFADLGVKHVSAYALSVEKGTAMYESGYKPDDDFAADLYDVAYSELKSRGYGRYEVSNFCVDGYFSRHNMKYWTRKPYIGVGAAAHSFYGGARSYNTSDISAYSNGKTTEQTELVDGRQAFEEYVMLGLRTSDGINVDDYFDMGAPADKYREIERLVKEGFIKIADKRISLTERAFYVMNEIILRLI